ncbi:hypothetical protein E2C01_062522 [Portunus trituberculatus]|uniref:CCHC-type domain-containing protein n=1 Tax=Portunus trituberculatus TaxID=210409 RepID=A0A5B7HBC6_PORTR|nr:hypothetical protein [Portunus trituberculatus]
MDYKKAETTALAMEAAVRDTADLQQAGQQRGDQVNKIQQRSRNERTTDNQGVRPGSGRQCYRDGGPHGAPDSHFASATCYACKKVGRMARMCRKKIEKGRKMHKIEGVVEAFKSPHPGP